MFMLFHILLFLMFFFLFVGRYLYEQTIIPTDKRMNKHLCRDKNTLKMVLWKMKKC